MIKVIKPCKVTKVTGQFISGIFYEIQFSCKNLTSQTSQSAVYSLQYML